MSSSDQQQENSSMLNVWFELLDSASGEPYKGASADKVAVSSSADVADLRKAIKAKNSNILSSFDPVQLRVYKNKSAFDKRNLAENEGKGEPMDPTESLGLLRSIDDMLIVAVPSSESSLTGKEPNPKRKERWRALNKILGGNAIKSKTNDYDVTWDQVNSDPIFFDPTTYVQPRRDMDEAQLDFLAKYISFTTKCFLTYTRMSAKHRYFIAPILISVCSRFDGDVDIVVEEDLVGTFVKAHGHFEFMIRRKNKAVCIVLAKKEKYEQGMAQVLVGCEVAAEVEGLDIVYGIVTDYFQWHFLRCLNDRVEMETCYLPPTPEGAERNLLKIIAEKIYAMLSEEPSSG